MKEIDAARSRSEAGAESDRREGGRDGGRAVPDRAAGG